MNIKVINVISSSLALSEKKCEKLYCKIVELLMDGDNIVLDFYGIEKTIVTFFKASYGNLFLEFPDEFINEKIEFVNLQDISKLQIDIAKKIVINKKRLLSLI